MSYQDGDEEQRFENGLVLEPASMMAGREQDWSMEGLEDGWTGGRMD